jgi:hypothetical protein
VYLPADGDRTARALKAIAASRGDGALLFFSDAGGYWLVDRTSASACGDHLGVVRVPAGHGKSALTRYRAWADRVSLAGLARRADLVVVAECAPGPRFALATVSESLKGAAPRDTLRIAQCCEPIAGRQLLFLRRVGAGAFEPLPFALPLRQAGMARNPNALSDEIEQVRESMREAEEHE